MANKPMPFPSREAGFDVVLAAAATAAAAIVAAAVLKTTRKNKTNTGTRFAMFCSKAVVGYRCLLFK